MYQEAEKAGDKAEKDRLSTRVRFHLSHKFGDEKKLMTFHQGKSYAKHFTKARPCPFIQILSRFYPDFILIYGQIFQLRPLCLGW